MSTSVQRGGDEFGFRAEKTGGYRAQYLVGAHKILESLQGGDRQWIRVPTPQIGTMGRTDAFQVKWSRYGGSVTLRDLATGSASDPWLIEQLTCSGVGGRPPYSGFVTETSGHGREVAAVTSARLRRRLGRHVDTMA